MRREGLRPLPAVVLAAVLVLPVTACASGDATRCEETFTTVATSVPGVASAQWDCNDGFGGGWVRGDVTVDAATEDEAVAVVDALLQAFAASPDLDADWSTPQEYTSVDGSIVVSAGDVGFSAVPNVGEVREHYGITPG